ncbi:hypothetical protein BSKO_10230 [Bryopsis sp. KO-2023]|nr:hypothetical protein BSKO_10230 [Bryopsis sp. KO-2023]
MKSIDRASFSRATQPCQRRRVTASAACIDCHSVKVSFRMPYRVNFGENLCLVGSGSPLGEWDVSRGLSMTWSDGDVWKADLDVDLVPELELQYKYVIKGSDGGVVTWMSGDNIPLKLPATDEEEVSSMRICDAWDGSYRDVAWDSDEANRQPRITHDERVPGGFQSLGLSHDEEVNVVASAAMRAFTELEQLMDDMSDLKDGVYRDPAAPEAILADRGVATKALKALALARAVEAAKEDRALS